MKKDAKTEMDIKNWQKAMKKQFDCTFIRINPEEKDFDTDIDIGKIHKNINKSSRKALIGKIPRRLLELEFKSNHLIK